MPASLTDRYNLVVLPLTDGTGPEQRFQFSANCPGVKRMVSPSWSESESRAALFSAGVGRGETEELFRGNAMASGRRSVRKLFFDEQQLIGMGLEDVDPVA